MERMRGLVRWGCLCLMILPVVAQEAACTVTETELKEGLAAVINGAMSTLLNLIIGTQINTLFHVSPSIFSSML